LLHLLEGKCDFIEIPIQRTISKKSPEFPIRGSLSGGCLSLIQTSIGTSWQMKTKNKILIIEDTDERGYRVDRMLHHLYHANLFSDIKAMICNFTGGNEPDGSNLILSALEDFGMQVDFPIFICTHIGHGYDNIPWVYGCNSEISLAKQGYKLTYYLS